ncbi:hypothetical protein [Methylocapsa palsarum]|uniref:hypothetical protein n=1 Tax=Methylocapsa palsarum TaxID=1612308 RepID=UPI000B84CA48|nr:hypothetical protein [Methylocapsa palsarum]
MRTAKKVMLAAILTLSAPLCRAETGGERADVDQQISYWFHSGLQRLPRSGPPTHLRWRAARIQTPSRSMQLSPGRPECSSLACPGFILLGVGF